MRYKDIYYEIRYYPRRAWKYKSLWLWSERMWKIRQKDKRDRYRAKRYARLRNAPAKMERLGVKQCKVCSSSSNLTIDHIIPISRGGKNNIENLQILCNTCNQLKGNNFLTPSPR